MTYIYYDNSGVIKMQSEELNETDLTVAQIESPIELTENKVALFEDGRVVLKDTPEAEKKAQIIQEMAEAQTIDDLKTIINKLL